MRILFADTFYWAALLNPRDAWHARVRDFNRRSLLAAQIVTTDEVLVEFLNFFTKFEPRVKVGAVQRVDDILNNPFVQVIAQNRDTFSLGLQLYRQRLDKGYSLTDCISMQAMRRLGLSEVLTQDRHFAQEGFTVLFQE